MADGVSFSPAWASPPGKTIADLLDEREVVLSDFAQEIGLAEPKLADLLVGRLRIDEELANRLADQLGATAEFWISRDSQYLADLSRLARLEQPDSVKAWLQSLPTVRRQHP